MSSQRMAKRYRAAVKRRGLCAVCVHRHTKLVRHGQNLCRVDTGRQHPGCETDGRVPRFEVDGEAVRELSDAA